MKMYITHQLDQNFIQQSMGEILHDGCHMWSRN